MKEKVSYVILIIAALTIILGISAFSHALSEQEINALKNISMTPHLIDDLGENPHPWIELLLKQAKEKMLLLYKDLLYGNAKKYQLPFVQTYSKEDNEDDYRYAAIYMLGKMEIPEAHDMLIKWLNSQAYYSPSRGFSRTGRTVLLTAISTIGDYKNPDDIKYLEKFAPFSEANIRRTLARTLAKIGTSESYQIIMEMLLKEKDSSTEFSIIESLRTCSDIRLLPVLQKIYDNPDDLPSGKDTVKIVIDSIKKRTSDKIMAALEYVSDFHCNYRGWYFSSPIDKDVILLNDINFLLSQPSSKMVPIYKDLLYGNFSKYDLMQFKDPLTHKDLIYSQCAYRHGAANLLARMNTPESITILREWLNTQTTPPPRDQWAWYGQFFDVHTALVAISNNYKASDLILLKKFLTHPDEGTRFALANALHEINTPQSRELLNLMLKNSDPKTKTYIEKVLLN